MEGLSSRPRELRWYHAAGFLFGDWGTSRLYVLGIAFVLSGSASFWYVCAMCGLVTLVGLSYTVVCKHFPDGGGVYSAARLRSRNLAVVGALLLFADYIITAGLSAYEGFRYILPMGADARVALALAILSILVMGGLNFFGLRRPGLLAFLIAAGAAAFYMVLAAFCVAGAGHPVITAPKDTPAVIWSHFANVILALSGVEAIANMTGVMAEPVYRNARKAILVVLVEVVVLNIVMAWAMSAISTATMAHYTLAERQDHMVKILAAEYVGPLFATISSILFGVLLISAANTAIGGMVSIQYLMSQDKELPSAFTKLNRFGMPWVSLAAAVGVIVAVLAIVGGQTEILASLYAIGVVGAIAINLLATGSNLGLSLRHWERGMLLTVGVLMAGIEVSIAWDKPKALLFACLVLGAGLTTRALYRAHLRRAPALEAVPKPETVPGFARVAFDTEAPRLLVAARGNPKLIRFAASHARDKKAVLFVLFVREVALEFRVRGGDLASESMNLATDKDAQAFFTQAREECLKADVQMVPLYAVHDSPAELILENAAMLAVDSLIMGASRRSALAKALRGDVFREVVEFLPEQIPLIIYA